MNRQSSHNMDKTIVERRIAHEGDKSRQAVKNLRSGAMENGGHMSENAHNGFEGEVLLHHAQSQTLAQLVNLTACGILGTSLYVLTSAPIAMGWFASLLVIALVTIYIARRFQSEKGSRRPLSSWRGIFQMATLLTGINWASAFCLIYYLNPSHIVAAWAFSLTLLATVLAFVNARYLKYGVLLIVAPLICTASAWMLMTGDLLSYAYAVIMIIFLGYFHKLGEMMKNSHAEFLTSKAERDQLIMALNNSRAISDEARRRAEDANLAKSRFLATMSHELRTPLNAILGFSEVISNEVMGPLNNEYYKEYIGDIHRSGAHLLKLINEILDLSRVEAGRHELNEEATSLAHAAEESQQMIKLKASEKNVAVNMLIQPDLPQIWADARAVRQVILNLLSNALKFTPPGGSIHVKVGWTAGGGQYVSVRDTGPGIPEEEIPIVLSSFGQGSIAIKSAEQGTGLGLPIVQALVHMHDGKFELKSKLREGTEVIATFPRGRVMEVLSPVAVDRPVSGSQPARTFKDSRQKVGCSSDVSNGQLRRSAFNLQQRSIIKCANLARFMDSVSMRDAVEAFWLSLTVLFGRKKGGEVKSPFIRTIYCAKAAHLMALF